MKFAKWLGVAAATAMVGGLALGPAAAQEKYKIFLSMSYIGNDWQAESANMVKAMAAHKSMADKVDLQVQVAGPNAQRQIQQINAMVQQGAKAIVIFPISPTALNQVVKNACDKGVLVFAYDAEITEPCAYNIHIDQDEAGRVTAQWLADKLGGKGNIVIITGVPGTSVDTLAHGGGQGGLRQVSRHPHRRPKLSACGARRSRAPNFPRSSPPITGTKSTVFGCRSAATPRHRCRTRPASQTTRISRAPAKVNGHRVQMLPARTEVEGANGTYRPMGYPSISYASPPYSGGLALKLAVEKLEGKDVPKLTKLPLPVVTNDTIKLCQEGTWEEMKAGCNAFSPTIVTNPGWFASIFSEQTPEIGLNAALVGQPEH